MVKFKTVDIRINDRDFNYEKSYKDLLSRLNGYLNNCKNLHWASSNMSEHELLDKLYDSISDFQDRIAEYSMGAVGQLKPLEISTIQSYSEEVLDLLYDLQDDVEDFYETIPENDKLFIGIKSECENFLGEISKYKYLETLTINK